MAVGSKGCNPSSVLRPERAFAMLATYWVLLKSAIMGLSIPIGTLGDLTSEPKLSNDDAAESQAYPLFYNFTLYWVNMGAYYPSYY